MGRILWITFALCAAVAGIAWYAVAPGVGSFQASGWLVAPALITSLVWLHRRLPMRLQWVLAVGVAIVGPVGYVVWGGSQWWNWGQLTPVPLVMLVFRDSFKDDDDETEPSRGHGAIMDGPWGPP